MIPENVNGFSRILADNPDWSLNIRSLLPQSTFIKGAEDNLWIGRFENLEEDFGNIMRTFGINCTLPHKNHSGSLHEDYKVELDSFSEDFIRSKHNEDIKRFGYSF